MKQIFVITCLLTFMTSNAQIVPIPDFYFKAELLIHDPVIDLNGDGEIQVSEAEATINIDVHSLPVISFTPLRELSTLQTWNL